MAAYKVNLIGHNNDDVVTIDTDNPQVVRSAIAINAGRYYYYEAFTPSKKPGNDPHVISFREAEVCKLDTETPA